MIRNKIIQYTIGPIGSSILGLLTLPVMTWFYSVEDIGRISMLQAVVSFFILLFCLGLDQTYVREYHEYKMKPKLLSLTLLPGLIISIITFIIILMFDSKLISNLLYDIPSTYLSLLSILCCIISLISRFLSLILRMEDRAFEFSMSQLLPKITFLLFILITIKLDLDKGSYNLITAQGLSLLSAFIVFLWVTRKEWIQSLSFKLNFLELKPLLKYGLPLVIGGLASWGLNVMDRIFLRFMSDFTQLGIYSLTASIAGVAAIFSGVFNTIWSPMVFKWVNEGVDLDKVDIISENVLATIYFIIVLCGLFSWILPYLFPVQYAPIRYLITVCFIGPLFYTLSETTAVGIAIARKSNFSMLASIIAMLANLLGNYLLVPKYGASGAAISTGISFWLFYIARTEFSRRVWRNIPIKKPYIITSILLICASLNAMFSENPQIFIGLWLLLLFIGLNIFRQSILSAYQNIDSIFKSFRKI